MRGGQKSNYKIVIFTTIEADSEKSFLGTRVNFFADVKKKMKYFFQVVILFAEGLRKLREKT